MVNPHVKISISLEEATVKSLLGKGNRSKQISNAIEALLSDLEGQK